MNKTEYIIATLNHNGDEIDKAYFDTLKEAQDEQRFLENFYGNDYSFRLYEEVTKIIFSKE